MTTAFRPVSETLEADLRDWVRRQGIVVWLDLDNHYGGFVERLMELRESGHLPYDVRSFRGSHLELMLALEPLAGGVDMTQLVIHLPGFTEETVRSTPMLELYWVVLPWIARTPGWQRCSKTPKGDW